MKIKKTPGQVVVIITIFIAVIILLSVVLINIGKVSDIKTNTSQIADSGALGLASQWGMYCNTLRDTMQRKARAASLFGTGLGCTCDDVRCTCLNWGLIIPLVAIFMAIVLMPFITPMISAAIVFAAINPLFAEVNAIMKDGMRSAAAQMTLYSSMRESSMSSMLSMAQFDIARAERVLGSDMFRYEYACITEPGHSTCTPQYYYYDLTDTPVAASLRSKNRIPRFTAWYWSRRHPLVTEAGLIPLVKTFIEALVDITEFNIWDAAKWEYTEVSLKVEAENITCASGECPDWAVPEKELVRIVSHISTDETTVIQNFLNWLNSLLGGVNISGFLPLKFVELTKRLLDIPAYNPLITYASRNRIDLPFGFGILINEYDVREIMVVSEAFRGIMLRAVELLNTPVSHRIPSLNNWLPSWYNNIDHSQDIYTRLGILLDGGTFEGKELEGIREWLRVLRIIRDDLRMRIPAPFGDNHYGLGNDAQGCHTDCIDCCCDCACACCGSGWATCTWQGVYCSACGGAEPPVCVTGDLYSTIPDWCPLVEKPDPCYSACGRCPDHNVCDYSCQFQGMLSQGNAGPTEVAQAVEILENLEAAIVHLREAIVEFHDAAQAIMNPGAAIARLQREAIYGWQAEKSGNLNIVRVNLDRYPARVLFPFIQEGYGFFNFTKWWVIVGQTKGVVGDITVSRYTNDISAGSWWTLKFRRDPGSAEWPTGNLGGIIHAMHLTGATPDAQSDFDAHAITSATSGHYGMDKEDIYIQRIN